MSIFDKILRIVDNTLSLYSNFVRLTEIKYVKVTLTAYKCLIRNSKRMIQENKLDFDKRIGSIFRIVFYK